MGVQGAAEAMLWRWDRAMWRLALQLAKTVGRWVALEVEWVPVVGPAPVRAGGLTSSVADVVPT